MSKLRANFTRRDFLRVAAGAAAAGIYRSGWASQDVAPLPSIRQLSRGPKFHWFGYYDKLAFDPTCRYVLGMEVDFEHRSPRPDDAIRVGMIDLHDDDKWIELGESRAWCWQQGCMLQWLPGSKTKVLWNDRLRDRFVCRILDVNSGEKRTVPHPIYALSPDGLTAVSLDFRRLNEMRPGYGYAGLPDPNRDVSAPKDSGIFRVDLTTGDATLIVPVAEMLALPQPGVDLTRAKSYFNALLFSPDGRRFEFLHRWGFPKWTGATRMLTAAPDGSDIRVVDPFGATSHLFWRDSEHILAWAKHPSLKMQRFFLFEDKTGGKVEVVGKDVMTVNGHCTYLPGLQWILNDTYPDKDRKQEVYLYNVAEGRKVTLGRFYSPPEYQGEWRCDTHPRFSPDGRLVMIDSPHTGQGRQLHLIDIGGIVGQT